MNIVILISQVCLKTKLRDIHKALEIQEQMELEKKGKIIILSGLAWEEHYPYVLPDLLIVLFSPSLSFIIFPICSIKSSQRFILAQLSLLLMRLCLVRGVSAAFMKPDKAEHR